MDEAAAAVRLALDLMHVPSRVKYLRDEPLPDGIIVLLRIAAGEPEAIATAVDASGRGEDDVKASAAFFIEQMLLAPGADSYRVLGTLPQASTVDLRRNMALLLRWLHPDTNREHNALYAGRITRAWDDLKTAERRKAYDHRLCRQREEAEAQASRNRRTWKRPRGSIVERGGDQRLDAEQAGELRTALLDLFAAKKD